MLKFYELQISKISKNIPAIRPDHIFFEQTVETRQNVYIPVPLEDAGFSWNYKCLLGKALIEENSYSIVEINNVA